jgi:hypothetical protein
MDDVSGVWSALKKAAVRASCTARSTTAQSESVAVSVAGHASASTHWLR